MQNQLSKYQKFEAHTILRTDIKNAPYNPRTISDSAKNKLRSNIKRVGLLDTIVWNKRTGNIVSGHQRISILDALEGSDKYSITVAVVDLDDKTEKEQNIFFNQQKAQGEFDFQIFERWEDKSINWKNTGFDDEDVSWFKASKALNETKPNKSEKELADSIAAIKEAKKAQTKTKGENFIILTFPSDSAKLKLIEELGFVDTDTKYFDAELFLNKVRG